MGTRNVGRCARARAGGSARGSRKLNQVPRPDVYFNYSEDLNDYSKREACHARHPLGLIPLAPQPSRPQPNHTRPRLQIRSTSCATPTGADPVETNLSPPDRKELAMRDTHWG